MRARTSYILFVYSICISLFVYSICLSIVYSICLSVLFICQIISLLFSPARQFLAKPVLANVFKTHLSV
jgi:hypothetical protein